MLVIAASALLLLQLAPPAPPAARDTTLTDAYLDAGARELVSRARAYRSGTAQEIRAYQAVAHERLSVGLRAVGRERLFYRRELAARIHWQQQGVVEIEVLGGRQALPSLKRRVEPVDGVQGEVAELAFDPRRDSFLQGLLGGRGRRDPDAEWPRAPLSPGSEAHYRYRSGDTLSVRLPDGASIRLHELQVLPRRNDSQLLRGSIWLDAASYAPVRAVFRLARPFDLSLDARRFGAHDRDDVDDVPGFLKPIRADVRFITVEYGLWHGRYWLPRLLAVDAIAEINTLPDVPLRFERAYSELTVFADSSAPMLAVAPAAGPGAADSAERCPPPRRQVALTVGPGETTVRAGRAPAGATAPALEPGSVCRCDGGSCRVYRVKLPADTAALLASEYLPASPFESGETLVSGEEVSRLTDRLRTLAPSPWRLQAPALRWDVARGDLLRYNRVEGLSLGARGSADFGALDAQATLRLGLADLEPLAELGVAREGLSHRLGLAGYRRLAAVEPATRPLGLGNSLGSLLLGRDDGDYFRTLGVELTGAPLPTMAQSYRWRLYAERQRAAAKETDLSLPHLFDEAEVFRENIVAERADQIGASFSLGWARGLDPDGLRWGADLFAEAATGDFGYARPALTLSLGFPLPGPLVASLAAAGGTSTGTVPVQARWYLGGPATLRGYGGAALSGDAFWRGRAELGTLLPGARLVLFSDAGWAGERGAVGGWNDALLSAGAGVSFLDGLVRADLARALRGEKRWRLEIYAGAGL